MRISFQVTIQSLALAISISVFPTAQADLAQRFDRELAQASTPSQAARTWLAGRHIVFVGGLMNEAIPKYFNDNVASSREDFGAAAVSILMPASRYAIEDNSDWLAEKLVELHQARGSLPMIVIGHSKGGAEVALTATRHPELALAGVVEQFVSVQGAIGGTPMALLAAAADAGLTSIRPNEARHASDTALASLGKEARAEISRSVFYVRTMIVDDKPAGALALSHLYLNDNGGHDTDPDGGNGNDGLIPSLDQKRADFGTDLGVLDADHSDLVGGSSAYCNSTVAYRRAFTRALLEELATHR